AGLDDLDAAQRGGTSEERIEADVDAGEDRTPEVLATGGDGVEGGGGAEVDDDGRPAVQVERGDGVGDAVGAHLLRVVVEDGQPGADAGLDHDRVVAEVALAHATQRAGDPRHRRAQADAGDVVVEREAVE